jgi:hypothetical protein
MKISIGLEQFEPKCFEFGANYTVVYVIKSLSIV